MADRVELAASPGSGDAPNMDSLLLPSWRQPTPAAVARERDMRRLTGLTAVACAINVALSLMPWVVPGSRSGWLEAVRGVGLMCAAAVLIYVSVRQWKLWRDAKRDAAARGEVLR